MNTEATTETAAQDAAAEAPDIAPAKRPSPTDGRARRKRAAAAPTMREITIDGVSYKVSINLSDAEAEQAARKLHDAYVARGNGTPDAATTPDVDRKPTAKPKGAKRAPASVEAGHVAIRLSKTAYEQAFAGSDGAEWRKQNTSAWKVLKAAKARSVGSSIAYFATVTVEDAGAVVAHLKATAKAWEKKGSKSRDANPAPLARNAVVIAGQIKAAK